ncbi:MAG: hypothetical protein ABI851_14905, partial [Saprospiraceae bacterium]
MGLIFSQPVVAWVHLLAYWFQDNQEEFYMNNNLKPEVWIMWENKWHTIRYGMQADIISYETFKNHKLSDHIYYWIDKLDSYVQLL